jgi:hypothetical protein
LAQTQVKTLVLRPDVVATVIEDGAVLLDLETKYFYTVNHAGWAILQMFEAGTTREQVEVMCQKWGAKADDEQPIANILDVIIGDKLVTPIDFPAADPDIELAHPWSFPTIEKSREPLQRIMKSPFDPTLPLAE